MFIKNTGSFYLIISCVGVGVGVGVDIFMYAGGLAVPSGRVETVPSGWKVEMD